MDKYIKSLILPFIRSGVKNAKIISFLKDDKKIENSKLPSIDQLNNFRGYYKDKKINEICIKEACYFIRWINTYAYDSVKSDELFVLDYVLKPEQFIFILTSSKLLCNAKKNYNIGPINLCIDATYKLISCKFPLVIIGTEDLTHGFHPIAFAIVNREDTKTYTFIMASIKNFLKDKMSYEWKVQVIKYNTLHNIIR